MKRCLSSFDSRYFYASEFFLDNLRDCRLWYRMTEGEFVLGPYTKPGLVNFQVDGNSSMTSWDHSLLFRTFIHVPWTLFMLGKISGFRCFENAICTILWAYSEHISSSHFLHGVWRSRVLRLSFFLSSSPSLSVLFYYLHHQIGAILHGRRDHTKHAAVNLAAVWSAIITVLLRRRGKARRKKFQRCQGSSTLLFCAIKPASHLFG